MKLGREIWKYLAMVTQIGLSMLAPVVLCVFVGYRLDERFGWSVTIPLLILGILSGVRNTWKLLKNLGIWEGNEKS
jgi:ATP synthase protein I